MTCSIPDCNEMASCVDIFTDGHAYCMRHEWYDARENDLERLGMKERLFELRSSRDYQDVMSRLAQGGPPVWPLLTK